MVRGSGDPLAPLRAQRLAVDVAHAEIFDLEEFLDAVFRAPVDRQMGPMPLSLHAAEGRDLGRDDALVDAPSLTLPRARGREGWGYSSPSATRQMRRISGMGVRPFKRAVPRHMC